MRILLFSGKGGVGKTSLAAATGLQLSRLGLRTLVMSVDPAHSLADSFHLPTALFHGQTAEPYRVNERLEIQEVNIQREIKRHWSEIAMYLTSVLRTTGIGGIEAEELAILPGMEELSSLLYVNQYRREGRYDVMVLDCAPTAESIRFVSMPQTLDWYMKHVFPMQRSLLKAVRPLANKLSPVELPPDSYFGNILDLFRKLEGIDEILEDPQITSVRLVTNPEQMVLRETERAYVYFSLHGMTVDRILCNRVLPEDLSGGYFGEWRATQQKTLEQMDAYFAPVEVKRIPQFQREVMGLERLEALAAQAYTPEENPAELLRTERAYTFHKEGDRYEVRLRLPFAAKGEVGLFKKGDELVVEVGTLRRHIGLPTSMAAMNPSRARLEQNVLTVEMKEAA